MTANLVAAGNTSPRGGVATIRIAPPLVIGQADLDWGLAQSRAVLGM